MWKTKIEAYRPRKSFDEEVHQGFPEDLLETKVANGQASRKPSMLTVVTIPWPVSHASVRNKIFSVDSKSQLLRDSRPQVKLR